MCESRREHEHEAAALDVAWDALDRLGEVGAIGSPPAVINAVVDALSDLGVIDISMPATSAKVWQAIQDAKG